MPDPPLFPVALDLRGRKCLVVGGGAVAARKIGSLLRCGSVVTVVALEAHEAVGFLAADGTLAAIDGPPLDLQLRPYRHGEAAGYRLVFTATGVREVDRAVRDDAEAAGVWVNSADDPDNCSFLLPSVHRDGAVSVAVSTGGQSPALARWLRTRVAAALGPGLGELADLLGEARRRLQGRGVPSNTVDWAAILDGPVPDLVARGAVADARRALAAVLDTGDTGDTGHMGHTSGAGDTGDTGDTGDIGDTGGTDGTGPRLGDGGGGPTT